MSKFGVQKQLAVAMTYFILNMAAVLLGEMLMGHALPLELTNVDPHYISGSNSKIIAPSGRANIVDAILHIRDPTERHRFSEPSSCACLTSGPEVVDGPQCAWSQHAGRRASVVSFLVSNGGSQVQVRYEQILPQTSSEESAVGESGGK